MVVINVHFIFAVFTHPCYPIIPISGSRIWCDSLFKAVLWIRIRIDFGQQDPDPDTGGQKLPA
jgi:hypothetical protein